MFWQRGLFVFLTHDIDRHSQEQAIFWKNLRLQECKLSTALHDGARGTGPRLGQGHRVRNEQARIGAISKPCFLNTEWPA